MKRLRLGVVGVGHLGKEHARILSALPDVELVGVADPHAAQAEAVALRCGTRAFPGHCRPGPLVDAVVIAAPTFAHHAVASDFLARGVPVLVEKPLTADLAQAEELVAARRAAGPCSRSATSSASIPPLKRCNDCRCSPSTSALRTLRRLHRPLHRRGRRPRSDDSRSGSGPGAGALAGALGGGAGGGRAGRLRGPGPGADRCSPTAASPTCGPAASTRRRCGGCRCGRRKASSAPTSPNGK